MSGWTEEQKNERMAKDAAKIRAPETWWVLFQLYVKTQPWETERRGHMASGVIGPHDLTTVARNGNGSTIEKFATIEELVKVWSVD